MTTTAEGPMTESPESSYLIDARFLAAQYHWRLLPTEAWAAAAQQIAPAPADAKTVRRALYTAYGVVLHAACTTPADAAQREQAYCELYDYFWRQAYYWDAEAACEIAQEAIILIFRSFIEPDLARCTDSAAFLDFAHGKLRAARTQVWRERARSRRQVSLSQLDGERAEDGRTESRELADPRPTPEEVALGRETQAERERWRQAAQPRVVTATLASLRALWRKSRLHRQVSAVIHTFMDRAADLEIASRLGTTPVNVQPLRSRGLDKLGEQLAARLAIGSGGCL